VFTFLNAVSELRLKFRNVTVIESKYDLHLVKKHINSNVMQRS